MESMLFYESLPAYGGIWTNDFTVLLRMECNILDMTILNVEPENSLLIGNFVQNGNDTRP